MPTQRYARLALEAPQSELLQTHQSKGLEKEAEFLQQKHLITEPQGNIYVGWALGVATPSPQLVGLTVLVMAAQFLAPLVSLIWSLQQLRQMKAVHLWDVHEAKLWDWEEVTRKTLGVIFTSLVIINGDNRLQRMDFQRERLRTLYPEIGKFWMVLEALFNSWCVAVCSLAIFPMVWACGDINDLILDVFGFLFMQSLDDYSGTIDYGIEQTDFDRIIHERSVDIEEGKHTEEGKRVCWVLKDGRYKRERQAESDNDDPKAADWLKTRIVQGDILYTQGRIVNFLALCFGCPALVSLKWVDHPVDHGESAGVSPLFEVMREVMSPQVASVALLLVVACLLVSFCWYMWHQKREDRSWLSFLYQVILFRPDPLEVRQRQHDVLGARSFARKQKACAKIASSASD